ncbi:MAG TPA: ATP-binding cassette domain-containing protein, partial [Pyrinomonadaceae bacterium]|nr:ATP-binding cassette domain-containing protein [Pyrinomonadaceae bacterium]
MSDIAIRCESLSKRYRIGEQERYKALRDVITDAAASPFRRVRSAFSRNGANGESAIRNSNSEMRNSIWALDDVSFEVKQGEVIGIIGRNGAGKSTLLKILSRITKPTKGHAEIHGRVGSLLEVGTGFHPELTGRENIYLNAAIIGMRKAEVERKFDEIVAFA